jgi:histidyl-tRNA synthetase
LSARFDAEIPAVISAVFERLAIGDFTIQLNHRKLLRGYFEGLGIGEGLQQAAVLRELDKLDKRGEPAVRATLAGDGFELGGDAIDRLMSFARVRSSGHADALSKLDALGSGTELFEQGRDELREILQRLRAMGVPETRYAINLSIARGLDYYTGVVYETTLNDYPQIGSICSGGRYDDLASHYTKSRLPGVGISIGLTRLFFQLRDAGIITAADSSVDVLVALLDDADLDHALALSQRLRAAGLNVETQLEPRKLARQLQYADRAGIRFVVIRGENEASRGLVAIRDLRRGEQFEVAEEELAKSLQVEKEQLRAQSAPSHGASLR